jgi:hypothetical protein
MALKLFRGVWFLSVLAVFVNLMYVYASLPEEVVIQEESTGQILVNREILFYLWVAAIVVVNILVYLIGKMFPGELSLRAWFHGLIITINMFFVVAFSHLSLYNSGEKFDYARIGVIIYGSIGLIILWAIAWPVYLLIQKIFIKQTV